MQINKNKTQILTISSSYNTNISYLMGGQTKMYSDTEIKMLGLYFTTRPTVQLQIEKPVRKANKIRSYYATIRKMG